MMAIQNFGFFVMYFQIYPTLPEADHCQWIRFWVAFFALTCFVESFVVLWMAMGGYTDDAGMFAFGWFLHFIVAIPYCICTIAIPIVMYDDHGDACRALSKSALYPLEPVYGTHCGLFLVYVWMMLSITYYSYVKPTWYPEPEPEKPEPVYVVREVPVPMATERDCC